MFYKHFQPSYQILLNLKKKLFSGDENANFYFLNLKPAEKEEEEVGIRNNRNEKGTKRGDTESIRRATEVYFIEYQKWFVFFFFFFFFFSYLTVMKHFCNEKEQEKSLKKYYYCFCFLIH